MDFKKRRWICLFAGMIIEMCSGITYAWSVFQEPLMAKYACTSQQLAMIYTCNFLVSAIGFLLIGPFVKKHLSIKNEVFFGSLVYVGCIIASAFAPSYWAFFILFGVFRSLGMSLVYPVLMSYAVELFPERSGLSSGIMAAGFAAGSIFWAPLATHVYSIAGDISRVLICLGIVFAVCMLPLSLLLKNAPADFASTVRRDNVSTKKKLKINSYSDVNRKEMLRMPEFYLVFIGFTFALACGNILVSQGSPIVRNLFEMPAAKAAIVVSAMSISNMVGRILCGSISDVLGKTRTIIILTFLTFVMVFCMAVVKTELIFVLCLLLAILVYGGMSSLISPATGELFGQKHLGENYTVMYCTYAMGSFVGPMLGTSIVEKSGYRVEFVFGCMLALTASIVLFLITKRMKRQNRLLNEKTKEL